MANNGTPTPDPSDPQQFTAAVYRDLLNQAAQITGLRLLVDALTRDMAAVTETANRADGGARDLAEKVAGMQTAATTLTQAVGFLEREHELTKQQVQLVLAARRSRWDVVLPVGFIVAMLALAVAVLALAGALIFRGS